METPGKKKLLRRQFSAANIKNVEIHNEPQGHQMWWDVVWNAGWRSLLNQMPEEEQKVFEKEHLQEITEVIGEDGVWFNTEVLIAVGIMR